jgi:alpha-L-rhamnosidase
MEDKDSPPVEHVRVRNCHFRRGLQLFSCGSEATIVRDVIIEDCQVAGKTNVLMLKLRPDTPQLYEDIHLRNIVGLERSDGRILLIQPWTQYKDLKGAAPPRSAVRNVTLTGVTGRFGSFGVVRPNPGQTEISEILLKNFDVQLTGDSKLAVSDAAVGFQNVIVNGKPVAKPG